MLNEKEVRIECEKHGFGYNYFGSTAVIETPLSMWSLELDEDGIVVNHINSRGNKSQKTHFHKQRRAWDIKYAINKIIATHNKYDMDDIIYM